MTLLKSARPIIGNYTIKPYPPRPAAGNSPGPTRETGNITGGNTVFQAGRGYPPRGSRVSLSLGPLKGVFYPNLAFFSGPCPAEPTRAHTCPGITWRLCGGLGASVAQDSRALRLWQSCRQWRAVPWSCIDAAPGCRLQRRSSANILTAWPGRVAQAPRAGRARAPWSCSPCWRPSSRTARLRDQLGLDDERELGNRRYADRYNIYGVGRAERSPPYTAVGDLPTSSVSAVQLVPRTMGSARTHPVARRGGGAKVQKR